MYQIEDIIKGLNPVQKDAVLYFDSPLLIIAGAGSGKTKVITHKIAYMVLERGLAPMNILGVTFTNRAANEMKERIEKVSGIDKNLFNISTFHSLGLRVLRETIAYSNYDEHWKIIDDRDRKKIIETIIKESYSYFTSDMRERIMKKIGFSKMNLNYPNNRENLVSRGFEEDEIGIFSRYFQYQNKNKVWDYEDLISLPVILMQSNGEVRQKYVEKFKYVLVDEFQDTNPNQYMLVKLIAGKHKQITIVGDDDQAIYSWRGANIRFLFDFEKDFPGANIIKLEQNYRSSKGILNFANDMIRRNRNRREKKMWTEKELGNAVYVMDSYSKENEAENIADLIVSLKKRRPEIFPVSVLYRINSQSLMLENELLSRNVKFRILKGLRFFDRKEVKDAIALLQLTVNPDDNMAFNRMVDFLALGIGPKTLRQINEKSDESGLSLFRTLKTHFQDKYNNKGIFQKIFHYHDLLGSCSFSEVLTVLLDYSGYRSLLQEKEENDKLMNINELIAFISKWESMRSESQFSELMDTISLSSNDSQEKDDTDVFLLTMHNAKGMEFPTVICMGINGVFMPFFMRNSRNDKEMEEERRLFYVASTRAMEQLIISADQSNPSIFLNKINPNLYTTVDSIYDISGSRKRVGSMDAQISGSPGTEAAKTEAILIEHSFFGKGRVVNQLSEKKYLIHFEGKGEKLIDTSIVPIKFL